MIELMITTAGLDALVNAPSGSTEAINIVSVGLTEAHFVMAPTLTAIPGEFKRLGSVSGLAVSENVIHMTAQDASTDIYDLRGIGLYLDDGTLFAVFSQATPLFKKVSISFFLLALDIAFSNGVAGDIVFGDASFLLPPATETVKGVAEVATADEAAAGLDHSRIITPLTLAQRLSILAMELRGETDEDLTALADTLAALTARTITGNGLLTGGGDLSASRILTVLAATAADVATGEATDRAVTPSALSGLAKDLAQNGYAVLPGCWGLTMQWGRFTSFPNTTSSALFPLAFPTSCLSVASGYGTFGGTGSQENTPVIGDETITRFGFSVFSADDTSAVIRYIAIGY